MLVFAHDYETTGVDTTKLGVVQSALCFATLHQNGRFTILEKDVQVLDPGHPIPAGASGVHGIYDHHVIGKPLWETYLAEQFKVVNATPIQGVVGYNSKSFDDRIARRVGLGAYPSIDLMRATKRFKTQGILQKATLSAAYLGLTGKEPENAHDAFADIVMTLELIAPAMEHAKCATLEDFLVWLNGVGMTPQDRMPFGKHKGVKLCNLPKDYVQWALGNLPDMDPDLRTAFEGLVA